MTYGLAVCRETKKEAGDAFQLVPGDGDWSAAGDVIKVALSGAIQSFDAGTGGMIMSMIDPDVELQAFKRTRPAE
jgi:hypothetical protein